MSETEVSIKFQPSGRTVSVPKGIRYLQAAARAGVTIETPCGGHGTCGKCKVRIVTGAPRATETEKRLLNPEEVAEEIRLACQAKVTGSCTVEIPEASLSASLHQILGGDGGRVQVDVSDSPVRKCRVELPPPHRGDAASDLERLQRVLGEFQVDVSLLRDLPRRLREAHWCGAAVIHDSTLMDFEAGDTTSACLGAAFDVGTTTVVGTLLDLQTGEQRAAVSRMNPQTRFGDDVLSRILYASQQENGARRLQEVVVAEVNDMLGDLAGQAGVGTERVYDITFSGNTTMLHLLTGIDPRALGQVPFVSAFHRGLSLPARAMGISIHPRGAAYVFPVIGGFVGGDTVAGILATDLANAEGPTVLVDIGTNGEIVVAHEGQLLAASTAAGPAFEGARISNGMRAAAGAIEHVVFDDDVRLGVIGNGTPVGLCGSALIDLVAEMRRCGILNAQGVMAAPNDANEALPAAIRSRLEQDEAGPVFVLAGADTSRTGEPVRFTQRDVREFQLAAAAIRSGIGILLGHVGLQPADVNRVLIAGAFGNYLNRANAQQVGLLPGDVAPERIVYVGNASLAGARLALASRKARERAEHLARATRHVDLSLDPDFQMAFAMAMQFPEAPRHDQRPVP
jgi:uncharacterized 2Fe-2S/4Fe-4S cluster protein (DUF4445 family)